VTDIKICGITNTEDAAFAAACGADAIGFIFYPKSPRYVAPEIVKGIIKDLPDDIADTITKVGVFVNHDIQEVKKTVKLCGLDMVQLHGDESPEYCCHFPSSLVIKALAPRTVDDLAQLREYPVRAILVDAYDPVRHGGTGGKSDWDLAVKVKETHPIILAGGLSIANIQEAIERVAPHAVDISSGAEISPGKKDHQKIKAIIELVRQLGGKRGKIFGR